MLVPYLLISTLHQFINLLPYLLMQAPINIYPTLYLPIQISLMQVSSQVLREVLHQRVLKEFFQIPNPKFLYIQKQLLQLLNFSVRLKLHELLPPANILVFQNDIEAADYNESPNIIFLLTPTVQHMHTLSSMIRQNIGRYITKSYYLYFVPFIDFLCVEELNKLAVLPHLTLRHFSFGEVPLAPRLYSLQLPTHCTDLDTDSALLHSLLRLSHQLGTFTNVVGKGQHSVRILTALQQHPTPTPSTNIPLILLDRAIDPITPLVTAQTYESLLNFFFGIHLNLLTLPDDPDGLLPKDILLNDSFYPHIAYLPITEVEGKLKAESDRLKGEIGERKAVATSVEELYAVEAEFVAQFERIQNHRSIVLRVRELMREMPFVNMLTVESSLLHNRECEFEDILYLSLFYPFERVARLVALQSQVEEKWSREREAVEMVLYNYRREDLCTLYEMEKEHLVRTSSKWGEVSESYELMGNCSYTQVHMQYNALSVRFVELTLKGKMNIEQSIKLGKENYIKGKVGVVQGGEVYVGFVGGVTYGQVACLRLLEKEMKIKINILATNVTSGETMIRNIGEK